MVTKRERMLAAINREEPDRIPMFELMIDHMKSTQDELPTRIEALRKCQRLLDDRYKRIIKMRYERNVPVNKIASYLKLSRRHIYHMLGQINSMLLRCVRRSLAEGGDAL